MAVVQGSVFCHHECQGNHTRVSDIYICKHICAWKWQCITLLKLWTAWWRWISIQKPYESRDRDAPQGHGQGGAHYCMPTHPSATSQLPLQWAAPNPKLPQTSHHSSDKNILGLWCYYFRPCGTTEWQQKHKNSPTKFKSFTKWRTECERQKKHSLSLLWKGTKELRKFQMLTLGCGSTTGPVEAASFLSTLQCSTEYFYLLSPDFHSHGLMSQWVWSLHFWYEFYWCCKKPVH